MLTDNKTANNYFDGLPVNSLQRRMVLLIGFGIFFDMMDNYNFGFVAPAIIKSWGISLEQVGQVNSLFFVGMFLGGLLGGNLSDRIGRRKSLLFSLLMFSICSIANGLVNSFLPFLLSRFFTGIGVASLVIIAVPYLAEMLPKETRGRWQAFSIALGCVAIPFLGIACKLVLPLSPEAWRLIYISGGLGLVAFLFGIFWLKESPRWLVSKGRIAEAEKVLEEIVGHRVELNETESEPVKKENIGRVVLAMFDRRNARNSLVLMSIFMLAYPAGFIFINWAPTMFSIKGFPMQDVLLLTMLMSFGLAAGPFLATYVSDKGGRKGPIAAMFTATAVLALVYANLEEKALIIAVAILIAFLLQANSPTTLAYLSELYPTYMRNTAIGIIYSGGRLCIALIHAIVPVVNARYGYMGVFTMMGMLLLITSTVTGIWGTRTSGKSLEELTHDPGLETA
jgi:MFS transporter, putative metabolite:H+ symporter